MRKPIKNYDTCIRCLNKHGKKTKLLITQIMDVTTTVKSSRYCGVLSDECYLCNECTLDLVDKFGKFFEEFKSEGDVEEDIEENIVVKNKIRF